MKKVTDFTNLSAKAAEKMADALNVYLATLQTHYFNLLGFHWHVVGRSFFSMHAQLEKMYNHTAEQIDEVAERILQLNGIPTRKFEDILKRSEIKQTEVVSDAKEVVAHVLDAYKTITKLEREIIAQAGELEDEATAGLLAEFLTAHEKTAWMLVQYSEE